MPPTNIYDILDNYDNFKIDFLFREQGFAITGFPVSPICMGLESTKPHALLTQNLLYDFLKRAFYRALIRTTDKNESISR